VTGLSVSDISQNGINLGWDEVRLPAPVYEGDTIYAQSEVLSKLTSVSRGDLSWRLTVPADGHLPGGGTVPHLIEWDCGARPWERMAAAGCDLETLILRHPKPEWLDQALHAFCPAGFGFASCERGEEPKLSARIITPSGVKII
jgi:hypothetical protein